MFNCSFAAGIPQSRPAINGHVQPIARKIGCTSAFDPLRIFMSGSYLAIPVRLHDRYPRSCQLARLP